MCSGYLEVDVHHRRKRRFAIGGARTPSRRWLRELPGGTSASELESCRNPTCSTQVAAEGSAHGFCERCWNSKVRILPVAVPGGAAPDVGPPDISA